ncbi:hypothetical protein LguiB_005894 [Lonicera macranthoides]
MMTTTLPPTFQLKEKIDLTDQESQIFELLLQVVGCFSLQTQIRVVGGWVRDKRFGTAEEDAYRRDLTINSLFYNINTGSVDDFSGRGIEDLRSRRIAAPLTPKQTFLDDPLRVLRALRAIRFGVRFGFILDEDLKIAASDHDVKAALARKIMRDRIGHEINLMISGKHPDQAMTYIWDVQIFSVILSVPHQLELPASEERLCVAYMSDALRIMQIIEAEDYADYAFDDEERRLLLYAALLLPFRKTIVCRGNDKKDEMVVIHIFRNSLKLKCIDAEVVVSLHNAVEKFMSLIPRIKSAEDIRIAEIGSKVELTDFSGDKLRMLAGLLLQEIKGFWHAALLLSMLLYTMDVGSSTSADSQIELDKRRAALFRIIESKIIKLDLEKIWEMKPLLNGNDIINVLDLKGGGPIVGELQKKLVEQQLLRRCRNRDECVEWLKQTHPRCSDKFDTLTKSTDRVRGNQQTKSKRRKQKEGVGG